MTTIMRRIGSLNMPMWVVTTFAFAFALSSSGGVLAQNPVTTPGGTINRIPKWTAGAVIQDSVITELNSNIGIGTTNPLYKLDIFGGFASQLHLTSNGTSNGLYLFANGSDAYYLGGMSFDGSQWIAKAVNGTAAAFAEASGAFVFYSNNQLTPGSAFTPTERARIDVTGFLGIGIPGPAAALHVVGTANTNGIFEGAASTHSLVQFKNAGTSRGYFGFASSGSTGLGFFNASGSTVNMLVTDVGNVGIGTTSPWVKLNVWSGRAHVATAGEPYALGVSQTNAGNGTFWLGSSTSTTPDLILSNNGGVERARITDAGRLGVGTATPSATLHVAGTATITGGVSTGTLSVTGNITATGSIAATYSDLAEWVPASRAIPAGTVVILDPERSNHVLASSYAYDTRVAGVVSAKPGLILGEAAEGKVMVATTGRVRVKVDASNGPIRVGDLLVTSDKEGIAMRSQPLDLGGTPIHRPGTLIGKALEPLKKGVGEILVLLSLQ